MARTMFVNPRKRRGRRKARKVGHRRSHRRSHRRARHKRGYRPAGRLYMRNAGITPFVSNPLIMSPNPRRRMRRRHRNPLGGLNLKSVVSRGLTYGGGAAISVAANTLFLNTVNNFWARNGTRFGGALLSAMFMRGELGAATAGAMLYPMMQELAAKFLTPATAATEADLENLAADLEDVIGELDESDLSDDDEMYVSDDLDDILS